MRLPEKRRSLRLAPSGSGDGSSWKDRVKDPARWLAWGEAAAPWLAAALGALALAWGASGFLEGRWARLAAGDLGAQIEALSQNPPRTVAQDPAQKLEVFKEANPFALTQKAGEAGTQTAADALALAGTLPGVGAWIRADGSTALVLVNQEFRGFKLVRVDADRIYLVRDETVHKVYLYLSGSTVAAATPSPPAGTPGGTVAPPGAVQAPGEGKDGSLSRELLDKLLMNPYDELSKVRLIPQTSGDVQGMQVAAIQPDSLLGQLGVQEGDTIQSLNGVPIRNLSDVSNAVNSLLGGARMDVTVVREGKPVNLGYAVK